MIQAKKKQEKDHLLLCSRDSTTEHLALTSNLSHFSHFLSFFSHFLLYFFLSQAGLLSYHQRFQCLVICFIFIHEVKDKCVKLLEDIL